MRGLATCFKPLLWLHCLRISSYAESLQYAGTVPVKSSRWRRVIFQADLSGVKPQPCEYHYLCAGYWRGAP